MQIGTHLPQQEKLEEFCSVLAEAEITYIELGPKLLPSLSRREATKFARFLKNQGITVFSVHAPYGDNADISCLEENKRKKALSSHKKIIQKMELFEKSILVIHPGEKVEKEKANQRLHLLRCSLEELLYATQENKIRLALENMPPGFVGDCAKELRQIIKEFNYPNLGICFDTGHSHIGGKLKEDFEILKNNIFTFHIHDNDGLRDLHLQPPYGTIPWENFTRWVEKLSFPHPLILECFPWGQVEFTWVKKEIELLFQGKIIENTCSPPGYVRCPCCGHFFFNQEGKAVCYCSFKNKKREKGQLNNLFWQF